MHELDELLIVDTSVTILINLLDHSIKLILSQDLPETLHNTTKLIQRDSSTTVMIKNLERALHLSFEIHILGRSRHHLAEFFEINGTVAIRVDLVDHVFDLGFSGVLAEGFHDLVELLDGDGSISIGVKECEGMPICCDFLRCRLRAGLWLRHDAEVYVKWVSKQSAVGKGHNKSALPTPQLALTDTESRDNEV